MLEPGARYRLRPRPPANGTARSIKKRCIWTECNDDSLAAIQQMKIALAFLQGKPSEIEKRMAHKVAQSEVDEKCRVHG